MNLFSVELENCVMQRVLQTGPNLINIETLDISLNPYLAGCKLDYAAGSDYIY